MTESRGAQVLRQALTFCYLSVFLLVGCSGSGQCKKKKYGVHDHPIFLDHCQKIVDGKEKENPALFSIFEEPFEDTFAQERLKLLERGFPRLYQYALEHNEVSSTDLWLIAELERKFGSLQDASIILVGAQEGRMVHVLNELYAIQTITVIDLPACLALAKWKLGDHEKKNVRWVSPAEIDTLGKLDKADFLISNANIARLNRFWQGRFLSKVFPLVKGGCILFKPTPRHWGAKTWDKYQFFEKLKDRYLAEEGHYEGLTANSDSLILFSAKKR
jgi:hypothetical protein